MLKIVVVMVVYFISLVGSAQTAKSIEGKLDNLQTYQINVLVNKMGSNKGKVYFALYDSEKSFLERTSVQSKQASIKNGVAKVVFNNLVPKTYAIICFHDENDNNKMDFQENGMPLEDYGASNNVMNYGPPTFDDSKFELTNKDLTFEIKF